MWHCVALYQLLQLEARIQELTFVYHSKELLPSYQLEAHLTIIYVQMDPRSNYQGIGFPLYYFL
jgi:hypothetical protein